MPISRREPERGNDYGDQEFIARVAYIYDGVGIKTRLIPVRRIKCPEGVDEVNDALAMPREGGGNDKESPCRSSERGRGDEFSASA